MREGQVYRRFRARDGREITLRAMRWGDLDDAVAFINGLVAEQADILVDTPVTREDEARWLANRMAAQENDRIASVVAEADGRLVGNSEVSPMSGRRRTVGVLGISIRDGYRDVGIGGEMMRELEAQSLRLGLRVITLEVYSTNTRARHVYERAGFQACGSTPKSVRKGDGYADSILMYKHIAPPGE